jgi:hypothetical protein
MLFNLDLNGRFQSLTLLILASIGLGTHNTTTPVTSVFFVFIGVAILDGADELGEFVLVFLFDFSQS